MRSVLAAGLDRVTATLLVAALILAALHHTDHVLRVDHSGWPFRPFVTPFTYSLLAYPVILFALFGPRRWFWMRWTLLLLATGFTLFAHIAVESPQMQFTMWAHNRSLDQVGHDLHNLPGIRSHGMGSLSVTLSMALNVTAVVASVATLAQGLRLRRRI